MEYRCMFAGFGGQGIISMGTLLSYAAMLGKRYTTFFPAYGIAMRGGSANCTVIVSEKPVASPVVQEPNVMVVMNEASLELFAPRVARGGWLFVNAPVNRVPTGVDGSVRVIRLDAAKLALEGGEARMANMAMLGAVMKITGMLQLSFLMDAMGKLFPSRAVLIEKNTHALELGFAAAPGVSGV